MQMWRAVVTGKPIVALFEPELPKGGLTVAEVRRRRQNNYPDLVVPYKHVLVAVPLSCSSLFLIDVCALLTSSHNARSCDALAGQGPAH